MVTTLTPEKLRVIPRPFFIFFTLQVREDARGKPVANELEVNPKGSGPDGTSSRMGSGPSENGGEYIHKHQSELLLNLDFHHFAELAEALRAGDPKLSGSTTGGQRWSRRYRRKRGSSGVVKSRRGLYIQFLECISIPEVLYIQQSRVRKGLVLNL